MARKNASKKHKGVRDILQQRQNDHEKIKNKINNPPSNPGFQEAPKLYKYLHEFSLNQYKKKGKQNALVISERKKKRKQKLSNKLTNSNTCDGLKMEEEKELLDTSRFVNNNIGAYPRNGRPFKPVPTLVQDPGESNFCFLKRVSETTDMVVKESKFQDRYDVDVRRNEEGDVVSLDSRLSKEKERTRSKKKAKREDQMKRKHTQMEEEPIEDDIDERERKLFRKDTFEFGETVHCPPTLETAKLQKKVDQKNNARAKDFLFLQKLKPTQKEAVSSTTNSIVKKKMMEIEREKAVAAYRQLKLKKVEQ